MAENPNRLDYFNKLSRPEHFPVSECISVFCRSMQSLLRLHSAPLKPSDIKPHLTAPGLEELGFDNN